MKAEECDITHLLLFTVVAPHGVTYSKYQIDRFVH